MPFCMFADYSKFKSSADLKDSDWEESGKSVTKVKKIKDFSLLEPLVLASIVIIPVWIIGSSLLKIFGF